MKNGLILFFSALISLTSFADFRHEDRRDDRGRGHEEMGRPGRVSDTVYFEGRRVQMFVEHGQLMASVNGRVFNVNPKGSPQDRTPVYAAVFNGQIVAFVTGRDGMMYFTAINSQMQPTLEYVNTKGAIRSPLSLEQEGSDLVFRAIGLDNRAHAYSVISRRWN